MIVITLTNCPLALRGDLTKWLQEISTGVYVGQVSARVRDQLWLRVTENAKSGQATMVFSANNEQRLDFRVHNTLWEPINFDGLKLMLRPSPSRIKHLEQKRSGYSNASKTRIAKQMVKQKRKGEDKYPLTFAVIDVETTGLSAKDHEIIEIGAIKVVDGKIADTFQSLVRMKGSIPEHIEALTGINDEMIREQGGNFKDIMQNFLTFVEDLPIIAHNGEFDYKFLRAACQQFELQPLSNKCIDTMQLSRHLIAEVKNYKLETLLNFFEIKTEGLHRSMQDCMSTYQLYKKLMNYGRDEK